MAEQAIVRFPSLAQASIARLITGLYEVTPEGLPIAGPLDEQRDFWIVAGFNGHGIMHSLPVTRAVAEAICTSTSTELDLARLDPQRFTSAPTRHFSPLLSRLFSVSAPDDAAVVIGQPIPRRRAVRPP